VKKALAYFESLAVALAEVENLDPEEVTEPEEPEYAAPDLYRYHPVGENEEEEEETWMELQPRWYQALIEKVRKCRDLDDLGTIGREVFHKDPVKSCKAGVRSSGPFHWVNLTRSQAGVFWTEYNLRKAGLERTIKLGPVARSIIQRIAKANGNLASLGPWLYKVQQGRIRVSNPPQKHEWTVIWRTYHERKEAHTHG
jgi:hypothetical protein